MSLQRRMVRVEGELERYVIEVKRSECFKNRLVKSGLRFFRGQVR